MHSSGATLESPSVQRNGFAADEAHAAGPHVMPVPVLLGVFGALIALTVVTVAVTWVDLGSWNLVVALGIATVKAGLVALYFMHLRYDSPFNAFIFLAALVFLGLFLSLTILDSVEYQPDIQNYLQAPDTGFYAH